MPADQDKNAAYPLLARPLAQPIREELLTLLGSHLGHFLCLLLSTGRRLKGFDNEILLVLVMDLADDHFRPAHRFRLEEVSPVLYRRSVGRSADRQQAER